jgi:hypothetical protein
MNPSSESSSESSDSEGEYIPIKGSGRHCCYAHNFQISVEQKTFYMARPGRVAPREPTPRPKRARLAQNGTGRDAALHEQVGYA